MLRPDEELTTDILWLGDVSARDPNRVGGKAAALARLYPRYPVPPGFVVPWDAFCGGTLHLAGLEAAYDRLGSDLPVAVRSSAIGEDGRETSFAGQHATFLHVRGAHNVRSAVQACWRSAFQDGALSYRRQHGIAETPRVAVLIQRQIVADAAAVAFSRDPLAPDQDHVVVNAAFGLGDAIVGGHVTPDTYVVRRHDLAVVRQDIADKAVMAVAGDEGPRLLAVPARLRRRPVLTEDAVRDLARLVLALEAEWQTPVDVEVAWDPEGLHLLQCRPITTL